jgi:3-oxoacyl-[acyl-carrier protein] reductase
LASVQGRGYVGAVGGLKRRLEGKVAIITGAGRGIGRATALRFAGEGAAVVVNDIDEQPANETVAAIKESGGRALASISDTTDLDAARALSDLAVVEFGALDILVNNAGITRDRTFHHLDDDRWDFVLNTNLRTAFHATLAAVGHMREYAKKETAERGTPAHHRKITFTTSSVALMGNPGQANYTAAKAALIGLTRTLARELGPFHINVNAIAPGLIETRLTAPKGEGDELGVPDHLRQIALMTIALGRFGQPEDVANTHLFLASDDADYITGVVLPVTGGQLGA